MKEGSKFFKEVKVLQWDLIYETYLTGDLAQRKSLYTDCKKLIFWTIIPLTDERLLLFQFFVTRMNYC